MFWVVSLATSQPWIGIKLGLHNDQVVVTQVDVNSVLPPTVLGLPLVSIAQGAQTPVPLTPLDMIEEPDMLDNADALRNFYTQQDKLFEVLSSGPMTVVFATDTGTDTQTVTAQNSRPVSSLPLKFWVQVGVGLVGLFIGIWVLCLRPTDTAARMVLLTGVGLAVSAGAAALYSSREIALNSDFFALANRTNALGTLTFGIGMVTLFLVYPRRIVPPSVTVLPALGIGAAALAVMFWDWPANLLFVPTLIAVIMTVLLIAIAAQVIVNRRDTTARAMLGWLGLSVVVGAGGFVLTAVVPNLLGQQLLLEQSTAFLFFLFIYAGIALGVARYRLFDLATWSFEILFYGMGVILLLLLDGALIYGLSVDRAPAFGIALAVIGLVYLPLRARIWTVMRRRRDMEPDTLFLRITEIAHATDVADKNALLSKLWDDLFAPLSIDPMPDRHDIATGLVDNGAALHLAPVLGLPALSLNWRQRGSKLFSSRDLQRAASINALIDASLRQNQVYLEAVTTERNRINRDMHDNLGILLVSALHTPVTDRKDTLIRQTLTDLREIIANKGQSKQHLPMLIADLRSEISNHFEAAQIEAEWHCDTLSAIDVSPQVVHVSRAFLRESAQNIIRHSGARRVVIRISSQDSILQVAMADNGHGFDTTTTHPGTGVKNLAKRLETAGGRFECSSTDTGTTVSMALPLTPQLETAAE